MGLRLIPKEEKFFEMFDEQAETIVESTELLLDLLNNFTELDLKVMNMNKVEHKADEIAHRIIEKLNTTFITPLDQEDIHALASALDDIVDFIDATFERMSLYKVKAPTEDAVHLANILHRAAEETRNAVNELSRFRKSTTAMKQSWIEINRLENAGDTASRAAIANLFDRETDAIEVIKWKEIYEHLETAIDKCEDVANILEQIVLKHA
jgi:uncharacterized protein